jgi:transcription initiation factor TFIIB
MRIDDKGIHSCLKKLSWAGIFNDIKKRMREKPNIDSRAILAPASYIPKIASSIGLSDEIILLSRRIIEYMARHCPTTASGKNPEGTAAASIYLASILLESKKSQKSIADSLGISEVTIRNRYRDIIDNLDIVVYV